jgi:hypothetical protein
MAPDIPGLRECSAMSPSFQIIIFPLAPFRGVSDAQKSIFLT